MKRTFGFLLLACVLVAAAAPALAGGCSPQTHEAIAAGLGVRWQQPVANMRVGERVNAIIVDPAKLQRFGMNAKANERVIVSRASENGIIIDDLTGRQRLTFTFDAKGVLTRVR